MARASLYDSTGLRTTRAGVYKDSTDKKLVVKRFTDITGVSISGGGTGELVTLNGETWLKVTTASGVQAEVSITPTSRATPIGPHIVWPYYIEDYTKISSLISFVGSAGYTGWIQTTNTFTGSSVFDRNGFGTVESNPYAAAISGTGFNFNTGTFAAAKFRITPQASQVAVVYLHSLFFMGGQRACAVLGFDDEKNAISVTTANFNLKGVAGSYTYKQVLDAYGFKGTVWAVTGYMDGTAQVTPAGTLTWAQLQTLVTAGWDVQVQTHYNPVDTNNYGSRLLGPVGYAAKSIASVDTTANTFTASAVHGMGAPLAYGYPIYFSGTDLPTGINTTTMYWARGTSTTAFTIHLTQADSLANTNIIDLTDAGTVANYTFRYGRSTNDHTAIQEDFQLCKDAIIDNLGITPRFIAYNQGSVDYYVELAAKNVGMLVSRMVTQSTVKSSYLFDDDYEFCPHEHLWVVQIDEASARTTAYYVSLIANAVRAGLCIHTYAHDISATTGQNMANFCEALEYYQSLGMIDIKTISGYYDERFSSRGAS